MWPSRKQCNFVVIIKDGKIFKNTHSLTGSPRGGAAPRTHRCHHSTCGEAHNSSSTDKKLAIARPQVMSTFRHLSISRHVFFVTTSPKQSVKSETLLISNNYRFSGHRSVGTKLAPPTLHTTDNPKGALSSPWVALMTFRCRVPFPVHIKSLLMA
jgi:hypothetical protein